MIFSGLDEYFGKGDIRIVDGVRDILVIRL
jgi:hypothetical protein